MNAASTLSVAVAQAVANLTQPLATVYAPSTILDLQRALQTALTTAFAASWDPVNPTRGSGRRCLSFTPGALPPRLVHNACVAASVQWADWARALGGREFDMFIDPGRVSVRVHGALTDLWTDAHGVEARKAELAAEARRQALSARVRAVISERVAALEDAQAPLQISALSKDIPAKPVAAQLAPIQLPSVPLVPTLPAPRRARSNSVSSTASSESASSAFSFESDRTVDSCGSMTSVSSAESVAVKPAPARPALFIPPHKRAGAASPTSTSPASATSTSSLSSISSGSSARPSRRERARMAKAVIDHTRQAEAFDMGKVKVITGGVMLGRK